MYDNNALAKALRMATIGHEDRNFIRASPTQSRVKYGEFFANCERAAAAFIAAGIKPGDRIALQVEKSVAALEVYLGSVIAGAVFLPLNTAYTLKELEYFIEDAQPSLFICDPEKTHGLEALMTAKNKAPVWSLNKHGQGDFAEERNKQKPGIEAVSRTADDLAAILYTSGTTGLSKGAMLSHKNLISNAAVLKREWQFTNDDCLVHALPIFHVHGLFVAINVTLRAASSLIYLEKFQADKVVEAMKNASVIMGVPTFYTRLLDYDGFNQQCCKSMRLFISGSAPLLAETHLQFKERSGHRILERYGMTETSMMTSNPYDGERKAGTVGPALPGVYLRIVEAETGVTQPQGSSGIIEVKGDNVFSGYWRKPEKTREEFKDDGYFITGDIGFFDEDGYLSIIGRAKDLIITGGLNVYPKEIEVALNELEGVVESAVIGIPHPDFGEAVVAVIVSEDNALIQEHQLLEQLQSSLAKFKQPKTLCQIDELPRNAMAKVQKNVLREQFAGLFD